jgi:hypothetical protein
MGTGLSDNPGVRGYAKALIDEGFNVKYFEPPQASIDKMLVFKEQFNSGKYLTTEQLKTMEIWRENTVFIRDAIGVEGRRPMIIDLGPRTPIVHSNFYHDLEIESLKKALIDGRHYIGLRM